MNKILRNLSWISAGNLIARPLWLLFLTVFCIPVFGDAGYGIFTASLALMAIVLAVGDAGISRYTIREVARRREDASLYHSNLLVSKLLLGTLAVAIGLAIGRSLGYRGTQFLALLAAGGYVLGLHLLEYCRSYFRAFEDFKWEAGSVIVEKVALVCFGTAALLAYRTPHVTLGALMATMVALVSVHVGVVHLKFARFNPASISWTFVRSALWTALPLGLAAQFTAIYFRTDAVMLEYMIGAESAGQYGAAYRLLEAVSLLVSMLTIAVYPRLSVLYAERDFHSFKRITRNSMSIVAGAGIIIGLCFRLGDSALMSLLKGGVGVDESAAVLSVLAFAIPLGAASFIASVALTAADDQKILAALLGVAAVFNITLNLELIPQFAHEGAAWATVATELLLFALIAVRLWLVLRKARFE